MRKTIKKTLFLTAILTALAFMSALTAFAQHGYRVTKNVTFKKGQVSTSVKGRIPNTLEGHEYIFRAREGQTLLIKLTSTKKDIGFSISTPDGETLGEKTDVKSWSGELPKTGEYRVVINTQSKGVANYTLEIQIASDI